MAPQSNKTKLRWSNLIFSDSGNQLLSILLLIFAHTNDGPNKKAGIVIWKRKIVPDQKAFAAYIQVHCEAILFLMH